MRRILSFQRSPLTMLCGMPLSEKLCHMLLPIIIEVPSWAEGDVRTHAYLPALK